MDAVGRRVGARLAVAVLATWLAPLGAVAQGEGDPPEEPGPSAEVVREARAYFDLAHAHYDAGRYEDAVREFEHAYELMPRAELLYNLHLAHRDAGNVERAVDTLRRYLADASDISASTRRTLERRLASMEASLAAQAPEEAPPDEPSEPEPPGTDEPPELAVDPEPEPEPEPPPPARSSDGLLSGAITSFSLAGLAAVVVAITGPLALVERDNVVGSCSPACSDAQLSTARSLGIATDVGLAFAGAGAIAGAVLAVLASMGSSEAVTVAPSVSADHAAIVVGGRL